MTSPELISADVNAILECIQALVTFKIMHPETRSFQQISHLDITPAPATEPAVIPLTVRGKRRGRPPLPHYAAAGSRKKALQAVITRLPTELHNFMRVVATSNRFPYLSLVRLHAVAVAQFLEEKPYLAPDFRWLVSGAPGARYGSDDELVQVNCFLPLLPEPGEQLGLRAQVEGFKAAQGKSMQSLLLTAFDWYMSRYHHYQKYIEAKRKSVPTRQQFQLTDGTHNGDR